MIVLIIDRTDIVRGDTPDFFSPTSRSHCVIVIIMVVRPYRVRVMTMCVPKLFVQRLVFY